MPATSKNRKRAAMIRMFQQQNLPPGARVGPMPGDPFDEGRVGRRNRRAARRRQLGEGMGSRSSAGSYWNRYGPKWN